MTNIIVSGCPRSGTSLTMRMLAKAGLPIAADGRRKADKDNLHGYFEVSSIVNRLQQNPELIREYDGQVVKVIHYGLEYLPPGDYRIVYVERDLDEVMMSMEKMIGEPDPQREKTKAAFADLDKKVKNMLSERPDVRVLYVSYRDLVTEPAPVVDEIIGFLGIDPAKKQEMMSAVDPDCYRNRKG
jgi:hypothetical protein